VPGLKDIARKLRRNIVIADEEISVRGLSADEIASIVGEFPEFEKLLGGFGQIDTKAMIEQAPGGIAKFIATGLCEIKKAPSAEDIADVRSLPGAAQCDLLAPIAELSLPKAVVSPFVALIRGGAETSGKAPDTQ
jgi:hypothetical protein